MTPCTSWAPWDGCNPLAERDLGLMVFTVAMFLVFVLVLWILRDGRK